MLGLDSGQHRAGMVVDALAATTGLLSLLGDRTVDAGEAGGGIGDPADKGYGAHGGGVLLGTGRVNNRTQ